jgi:hypothetical protein
VNILQKLRVFSIFVFALATSSVLYEGERSAALAAGESKKESNIVKNCVFQGDLVFKSVWSDPRYSDSGKYDVGDYELEILSPYQYTDCAGVTHAVPSGFVFNGASIPRAAWSIIGFTPLSGALLGPSLIHDYLCEQIAFTSAQVHDLFYEAMIANKVDELSASMMYAAVREYGPQWNAPGGAVSHRKHFLPRFSTLVSLLRGRRLATINQARGTKMIAFSKSDLSGKELVDFNVEVFDQLSDQQVSELEAALMTDSSTEERIFKFNR